MNRLTHALEGAIQALRDLNARAALIGGLAVSARAEPRFTRDVDLAVAVRDDAEAEALVHALGARGYSTVAVIEQAATSRLATVRLVPPGERGPGGIVIDLLFASSGIEPDIVAEAEPIDVFAGLQVPVARIGHLIVLKLLSRDDQRRPQDAADLRALAELIDETEDARARTAAGAIMARGFARGRDLNGLLEAYLGARTKTP